MSEGRAPAEATYYYERYWADAEPGYGNVLLPHVRELLEPMVSTIDECLDVGCGRGAAGIWIVGRVTSYEGVDVSGSALQVARDAGLTVRQIDNAGELPYPDHQFDLVLCLEVLEHLVEPGLAAEEILRVLRPGGRLIATVPNVAHWRRRADLAILGRWNPFGDSQSVIRPWRDPHVRFFTRSALGRMLAEVGYEPVLTGGHAGPWLIDLPGLRRLVRRPVPGPLYRRIVRAAPSLFAHNLHAVAFKPLASPGY
jgi:SAM-dependent methyltransferase